MAIHQTGQLKSAKINVKLTRKFQWQSLLQGPVLHFLLPILKILKIFLKHLPLKWNIVHPLIKKRVSKKRKRPSLKTKSQLLAGFCMLHEKNRLKFSLPSRRLEEVGKRENRRARGRHARGDWAPSPLACLTRMFFLLPTTSKRLLRRLTQVKFTALALLVSSCLQLYLSNWRRIQYFGSETKPRVLCSS